MSSTTQPPGVAERFVARLETLDAAGRARLKRNAGRTLDASRAAYEVFFPLISSTLSPWEQDDYFLVATLYAVGTRRDQSRSAAPPRSLGASLRSVRQGLRGSDSDERAVSLDKRFGALLSADREQLPFRLRQIVGLLVAARIEVDWVHLLRDVRGWTTGEGRVQRRWAEDYFVGTWEHPEGTAERMPELSVDATNEE